ncbi:sodium-dependent transporter [Formosa sp. S-31]|uniref:sodium-dependent transporter n=1 Tax=Formosa sp. S-31 TaxID=2790949 RepID=UPI003EB6E42A
MASRGNFNSKFGFIAAAAGTAVGLGNIWRFPFEVANGGGAAFLLVYLAFCFIFCLPIMLTEIAVGRNTQKDASGAFGHLGFPKWRFLGKMGILSSTIALSFYITIAAWSLGYVIEMLVGNFSIGTQFNTYVADIWLIGTYGIVFMVVTAIIVSKGIAGGIEKASKLLMPILLVMIVLLSIYTLTLEHAIKGVSFYLIPDFSKLNFSVVYGAISQAFFSLSIGLSIYVTFGSYISKDDNLLSSAALITLSDVVVAFLSGFMLFPIVAYISGGLMDNVSGGPGLIFETLPGVFASIGNLWGSIIGVIFFLLLTFAALTSAIGLLEVPVTYLIDTHKMPRRKAVIVMCILIFVLGIPSMLGNGYSSFFTNFIHYGSDTQATNFLTFLMHSLDILLISGGILISVFAIHVWKDDKLAAEISSGFPAYNTAFIRKVLRILIGYVCPVVLSVVLLFTILDRYFGITII